MKVASFLSVCTLALTTAVAANHGQFEHNSVTPAHTEAPANKPAHHWASREAREHEHSVHTEDSDKKATHHWEAREAREPHHVHHSREAGRHEYTHQTTTTKPSHYWEAREARESREHETTPHGGLKPIATRHHAREAGKPTARPSHSDFKDEKDDESKPTRHWLRSMFKSIKNPEDLKAEHRHQYARDADHKNKHTDKPSHHFARDADHKDHKHDDKLESHHHARDADHKDQDKHTDGKPSGHHFARDAAREPKKTEPMHTGGAVAGKPGHYFVRSAQRPHPTSHPAGAANPFAGTRWTPGSAISSVRGILTGGTGIKHTCDRCIAAMEVGQSLAQQGSVSDFSNAVVGLCQQVRYKSNDGCASAFAPGKVGPYISTLTKADLGAEGKGFCKSYFGAC